MRKAYGFAALTIFAWSTLASITKILLGTLDVMFVLAVSSDVAALSLLVYCIVTGKIKDFHRCSVKEIGIMAGMGFVGYFLYNYFYLVGIDRLPSQQAMVINYLWPALIILFSAIIFHEKLTWQKTAAIVFSVAGVAVVAANGDLSQLTGGNLGGVISCLTAAVFYGLYASLTKKMTYPKEIAMLMAFIVTGLSATICSIFSGSITEAAGLSGMAWLGLLYSGIFVNGIGYTSWMLALEYGNTSVIANLAYLVPFGSILVAHFVIREEISVYSVIGLVMIVGGISLQFLGNKKQIKKEPVSVHH